MNPFKVGDTVKCTDKNRFNGEVARIYCNQCTKCHSKDYADCTSSNKTFVIALFQDGSHRKRFKYTYDELQFDSATNQEEIEYERAHLEKEPVSMPQEFEQEICSESDLTVSYDSSYYDLSPPDIKKIGVALPDIPLIDCQEEPEDKLPEPVPSSCERSYSQFDQQMEYPI